MPDTGHSLYKHNGPDKGVRAQDYHGVRKSPAEQYTCSRAWVSVCVCLFVRHVEKFKKKSKTKKLKK